MKWQSSSRCSKMMNKIKRGTIMNELEHTFYDKLMDCANNFLEEKRFPRSSFRCVKNKESSSIWFNSSLVMRIRIRKNYNQIDFPVMSKQRILEFFPDAQIKKDTVSVIRAPESSASPTSKEIDMFCALIYDLFMRMPHQFSCCHRYMECSNAKRCTDPDTEHALGCEYRRNLQKGIIFFGVNRNV